LLGTKITAAVLSLAVVIGSYWVWNTWSDFQAAIPHGANLPGVSTSGTAATKDKDGPDQNILLLGNDSRDGATPAELAALNTGLDGGSSNTDTMMIMHIPGNGSKATIISFPRDSYVAIPGHGKAKLNAAYPDGYAAAKGQGATEIGAQSAGIALLSQTLGQLTGLHIDHYVQIDLLGFYRISNAIGGVPVLLCQPQKEANSGINLPAGLSTVSGTQALAFVRQRYGLPLGDLDRVKRQQYFLKSTFHKLLGAGTLLNPFSVQKLLSAVSSSLLTDPSIDILGLAADFADMAEGNLSLQTVPTDGFADNDAGNVVVVNPAEVQSFVDQVIGLGSPSAISTAPTVAPSTVTVSVLNGSNENGIATRNADQLRTAGFAIGTVGDAPAVSATTQIQYPAGLESGAKTLALQVPGAQVVQSATVKGVTLVLGTDGQQVTGLGGTTPTPATGAATSAAVVPIGTGVPNVPNQPGCIN
jgi:LCP family protein required for cell wall assembly